MIKSGSSSMSALPYWLKEIPLGVEIGLPTEFCCKRAVPCTISQTSICACVSMCVSACETEREGGREGQ